MGVLLLETLENAVPLLEHRGILRDSSDLILYGNTAQALLILAATTLTTLVVRRYTHRALDRRIRESMETLAYLEGQRRRRRTGTSERRDVWETRDEE